MSNPAMIPAETALRFINPRSVEVGQLYTINALGTNAAKLMQRFPRTTHTVCMRDGDVEVAVTVRPTANDIGQYTYACVEAVTYAAADALEEIGDIEFAAGLV